MYFVCVAGPAESGVTRCRLDLKEFPFRQVSYSIDSRALQFLASDGLGIGDMKIYTIKWIHAGRIVIKCKYVTQFRIKVEQNQMIPRYVERYYANEILCSLHF